MSTFAQITQAYYSAWLGVEDLRRLDGIVYRYPPERNVRQEGYPHRFDLYLWIQTGRIVVSYGDSAAPFLPSLQVKWGAAPSVAQLTGTLTDVLSIQPMHSIKYCFTGLPTNQSDAKTLGHDNFESYRVFFAARHPNAGNLDWLPQYFESLVRSHCCVGVFQQGTLVSCTDAPGMPYLADQVQEIGINTLPEHRGRGYGTAACIACARNILAAGKVPLWSTGMDNVASQKTAERVGFVKLADVLTVTLG